MSKTLPSDMPDPYKVINYDQFDFQQSSIIKPKIQHFDAEHSSGDNKKIPVVVYSHDRNKLVYPLPNQYVVDMPDELQDVLAVEMVVSNIAFNPYNIMAGNNTLYVSGGNGSGVIREIILEPGKYTTDNIIVSVKALFNSNFPAHSFDITYDEVSMKFTITASSQFTFHNQIVEEQKVNYPERSLLTKLGFGCKIYTSVADGTGKQKLVSEFASDLSSDNDTIVIALETMGMNNSVNTVFNKSFAVLHQGGSLYESCNRTIRKVFNPPLARLAKIRVSFTDVMGKPYDFQNRDHILELVFEIPKSTRRYKAYIVD